MEKFVMLNKKVKFSSVAEARVALSMDRLGTAYVRADKVFVITQRGFGTFTLKEWKEKA